MAPPQVMTTGATGPSGGPVPRRQLSILDGSANPANTDDVGRPPCPLEHCPWWSALSFAWLNPIIKLGSKRTLQDSDLPALPQAERAERLQGLVLMQWAKEMEIRPHAPRLWRALLRAFVPLNLSAYPLFLFASLARILQAVIGMKGLIDALEDPERPGAVRDAYFYACVILVLGLFNFLALHQVQFMGWRLGLWMRTATEAAIFQKVLRMPLSAFAKSSEEAVSRADEGKGGRAESTRPLQVEEGEGEGEREGEGEEDDDDKDEEEDEGAADDAYQQSITPGLVMNMATTDVDRFQRIGSLIHYLVFAPLDILIVSACGIRQTGPSFLIGVAVLLLLIPTQALMANALQRAGKRASVLTDKRVRLTKQMVEGARAIKMGGWEPLMEQRIDEARAREMTMLRRAGALRGVNDGLFFLSPVLVGAAVFVTDWAMGRDLGPGRVFTTLTLVAILQWNCVYMGGRALQSLNELWVSVNRLEHLFRMPELLPRRSEASSLPCPLSPPAPAPIRVSRLSYNYYGPHSKAMPALRQISFKAEAGTILGVVGPVGSGKSTLIKALLGELGHADQKHVLDVGPGPIAYAAQEPWILTGSVRDNIVMGRPFDADRYRAVLKAARLYRDMREWAHWDQTIIGDRGANISGGQKARIGLARMAYGDAALYLIDDALSALDPRCGRRVFERLICGLLRGKTRVLVTHQLQYLMDPADVPSVLYLSRGKVRSQGSMLQLLGLGLFRDKCAADAPSRESSTGAESALSPFVVEDHGAEDEEEEKAFAAAEEEFLCAVVEWCGECQQNNSAPPSAGTAPTGGAGMKPIGTLTVEERKAAAEAASIIASEQRQSGGSGAVGAYIEGMGGVAVTLGVLVLMVSAQVAAIFSNLQLSNWVRLPFEEQQRRARPVYIYLILVGIVSVLAIVRALVFMDRMLGAAQRLHDGMIHSLLRTPIAFYDANPTGRIINRTTKDVLVLDVALPVSLYAFVQMALICLGTIAVIVSVNPWLFFLLIPLVLLFIPLRRQFLNTSREVRRLESIASSPVYSLLSETMAGLASIRSIGVVPLFECEFNRRLNGFSRPFFIFFAAGRHLGFRLDLLCWIMTSATAFASLASAAPSSGVSRWLIGMSLMYVLSLAGTFQWAVRQFADVENELVSVERVKEYCLLPSEAALDSGPGQAPPAGWPDKGAIVATDLDVAYRPGLPPVLHRLTFHIEGGQRVGVVGRSGSGKTTLLQALFRLMEASGGRLQVDGVDVASIGLHDLRRSLAIVPQDPFLFTGTLRQNLDPLGQHDDAEIWSALRAVQLEEEVRVMGVSVDPSVVVRPRDTLSPRAAGEGQGQSGLGPLSAPKPFAEQEHPLEHARFSSPTPTSSGEVVARMPSSESMAPSEHSLSVVRRVDSGLCDLNESRHHHGGYHGGARGPGLDLEVSENGANFSQGERQLLCLARAILQRARILVCDEATASVDMRTDQKIQAAIRERFEGATVLMVAHRLNTIIDADLVLVLAQGRLLEIGHPYELLSTATGPPTGGAGFLFRDMVQQTGRDTEEALRRAAKAAWSARRG